MTIGTRIRRVSRAVAIAAAASLAAVTSAQQADPRVGLKPGEKDAGAAAWNLELVSHMPMAPGFVEPTGPGGLNFANSDLAFKGPHALLGNFNGFNFYDIEDPRRPKLRVSVVCPGGQGDLSVYGHLLFMSVEQTRGRIDCGTEAPGGAVSPERFRGVRIFDISNLNRPKQIAAVQTCRGSHTHTLVVDPKDTANIYVYGSGTSSARSAEELAGCSNLDPREDPNTALFSIDVIQVPLAAPQNAKIVNRPRIFADQSSGAIAGLWSGGDHGPGTQRSSVTNQCHDITVYAAIGLAAGACSGNGILLDIKDPVHPKRLDQVSDVNFAYWHSASFNNDGTKVIFTDEWGGGTSPRCRDTDLKTWGANAHEIAFFDRGPFDASKIVVAGYWSAYWYNGHIYGSEIARGLDIFRMTPSDLLSQNEIDAAMLVKFDELNVQAQPRLTWPASFVVARAYIDQLIRSRTMTDDRATALRRAIDGAEKATGGDRRPAIDALNALLPQIETDASAATGIDAQRLRSLADTLRRRIATPETQN